MQKTMEQVMRDDINNRPLDNLPFFAYADLLEEKGDSVKAEFYRNIGLIYNQSIRFYQENTNGWYYAIYHENKLYTFFDENQTMFVSCDNIGIADPWPEEAFVIKAIDEGHWIQF